MNGPWCWICMRRVVVDALDVCGYCQRIGVGGKGRQVQVGELSLQMLVATQESGWVPGDSAYAENEIAGLPERDS